jgi:membrane-bound lytic murein transglycosylase B
MAFVDEMARDHGFDRAQLAHLLGTAKRSERVIELMDAPIRRPAQWFEYAPRFLSEERIAEGVQYLKTHAEAFNKAQTEYGVPAEVIAAIIGVETFYGRITGSFSVLDALATLAFDYPRRAEFFRGELKHFLLLNRARPNVSLFAIGSYAGAMGLPQFMPGSYLNYAVDFDADTRIDLWKSAADIIGSVANYFVKHGWKPGQPVWSPIAPQDTAKLPALDGGLSLRQPLSVFRALGVPTVQALADDAEAAVLMLEEADGPRYYMAYQNWYVITRYNRSRLYASAVWELAQAIKQRS